MSKHKSTINLSNLNPRSIIIFIATLVLGLLAGSGIGLNISPEGDITVETDYAIELADEQVPTVIENEAGEAEVISAPTVEEIDGGEIKECPEGEDCGMGAYYEVDVTNPTTIRQSLEGKCVDVDNYAGSQCVDSVRAISGAMTGGRQLTTCKTGRASGMMDCWQENAGDEFEVIWNPDEIQPGDLLVSKGGQWGHTNMAIGYPVNGYVAAFGTNQGGASCQGGGSSANVINMSLKNFIGAYRWKNYVKVEPTPEPEPEIVTEIPTTGCTKWNVVKGDTMSKIMLECENTVRYGAAMDAYAKTWYSLKVKPGQSVYEGWTSGTGYGLYAGDKIEHRVK